MVMPVSCNTIGRNVSVECCARQCSRQLFQHAWASWRLVAASLSCCAPQRCCSKLLHPVPQPGVQCIAQAIAQQVDPQHGHGEGEAGKEYDPEAELDVAAAL